MCNTLSWPGEKRHAHLSNTCGRGVRAMPQAYDGEELIVDWTLLPAEAILVGGKRGAARLGFAVLLKFFQREGRFPQRPQDVPPTVVAHLAAQVGVPVAQWRAYDWDGRAIKYHRAEIR